MLRKTAILAITSMIAMTALAGCGSGSTDEADMTARIAIVPATTTFHAVVADSEGLYQDSGLDASVTPLANLANAIPGLGNQHDIVYGTEADAVLAAQQGFDIVVIAGSYRESRDNEQVQLLAGKGSGITEVADLAGKRVALPSLAGTIYASMLATLDNAGLAQDDVTFVEIPFPNMLDQLNSGQADAILSTQPFLGAAVAQGHVPVSNPFLEVADPTLIGMWLAERTWAEQHADAIAAFRTAMDAAVQWVADNDTDARELLSQELGIPAEVAANLPFPEWTTDVQSADFVPWIDVLRATGQLEGEAPEPEDLVFTGN